jgi:hypothetical protein
MNIWRNLIAMMGQSRLLQNDNESSQDFCHLIRKLKQTPVAISPWMALDLLKSSNVKAQFGVLPHSPITSLQLSVASLSNGLGHHTEQSSNSQQPSSPLEDAGLHGLGWYLDGGRLEKFVQEPRLQVVIFRLSTAMNLRHNPALPRTSLARS